MNKCKIIIIGLLSLLFTGCQDFLDRPSQDNLSMQDYCKSEKELNSLTAVLYGSMTWNEYSDKFAWCAHELMSGNVYHEFGDEGQFFFLNFNNTNPIMQNGYKSLSAVVARANGLINEMPGLAKANGLSDEVVKRAVAEAKMYRGMAYFLMTELWGEVPVVLDNAKVIRENLSEKIPRAQREFIYQLIEKDWLYAADHLPKERWGEGWRVTQWGARGMLAKLYLTMASCQNKDVALYKCDDVMGYYQKASDYANEVLKGVGEFLEPQYKDIFTIRKNSAESLFALQFYDGAYGVGSSRQVQFGRSKIWNGNLDTYGGGKGLTVTLFNSFDKIKDTRLKEISLYNDGTDNPKYTLDDGTQYTYYLNPKEQFPLEPPFGSEDVGYTLNGIKKYVYGYRPTGNYFSCPMSHDFLRVADVMLIVTEAEIYLNGVTDVSAESMSSKALEPLNKVRKRAGLDPVSSIAMCIPERSVNEEFSHSDGTNQATVTIPTFTNTYDLMQERRWEFALECQSWLDLKRLSYRDKAAAEKFVEQQDRAYSYKPTLGLEHPALVRSDYNRVRALHELTIALDWPEANRLVNEKQVYYANLKWFLPLPVTMTSPALLQAAQAFPNALDESDEYGRFPNYPY